LKEGCMEAKEIFALIKAGEVKDIKLWFTDILGRVKGFTIYKDEVERALSEGINFDGSSIEGLVRIEESDLTALPDLDAVYRIPDGEGGYNLVILCDVFYPDGRPVESSPRYILRNALKRAEVKGFSYFTGVELEFFVFNSKGEVQGSDGKGYFDIIPHDRLDELTEGIGNLLNTMGVRVEMSHHEVAPNQHELDFRYQDAMRMADNLQIAKYVVKEMARKRGLYATFMPKPVFGINGSGMHVHQSLFRNGRNAFFENEDPYHLSSVAKGFIAGLLKHSKEITCVTNQWVNSYKRLVAGYEAPVYISWGRHNRSALVRVPAFKKHKPVSCRIEYRAPDPATNPYLCFSVMLSAGLKGIEEGYPLPEPVEEDIFIMTYERKRELEIDALPDSLYAAIMEMERSELVKETFGDEFFEKYIRNKYAEWEEYRIQVTDYEIKRYINL